MIGDGPDGLVVVGPSRVEVEHSDRTLPLEVTFRLRNPTARAIRIIDVRTSCSCSATDLSGRTVPPGDEVTLRFRIKSFDTYRSRFAEHATVFSTAGELELQVVGRIPPNREALAFPPALFIEPDDSGSWPERTIRLRVPKECARDAVDVIVEPLQLGPTTSEVVEESPHEPYREFVIRIGASPAFEPDTGDGMIRVEAGCTPSEIPVRFAGRTVREG